MESKMERLKWFEANLKDKHPDVTIEELSQSFRLDPGVFTQNIINGQEFDSMAGSVIRGFLGCSLNEFVEGGRAICADGSQPSTLKKEGDDWQSLMTEAGKILKADDDKARALATIIRLMLK